jgi:hypothetical protein
MSEYSSVSNNVNNLNDFLAENSPFFANGNRMFNQWTDKKTDSCEYKQQLNLATKPMEYFVNSINNISGLKNDEQFLSFTPIGNAATQNISNVFDRPIPSTLQTTSSVYTFNYNTSPFLGASNNVNVYNTDIDLTLKTGLGLRKKNNQSDLASKKFPNYGDIHKEAIEVTDQNFGQFNKDIHNVYNKNIPGLNNSIGNLGVDRMNDPSRLFVDSRVALQNAQNGPIENCRQFKNHLLNNKK